MTDRDTVRDFLSRLVASRGLGDGLCQAQTSVDFHLTDAGTTLTANLYADGRRGVVEGQEQASPILIEFTSRTASEIFSGTGSTFWQTVADGETRVSGPANRVADLWSAITYAGALYFGRPSPTLVRKG